MRRAARWPPSAIASIGSAAPSAYASVSATTSSADVARRRVAVTAASTGPRARHEDEPEARAEQEAAAEVAAGPAA